MKHYFRIADVWIQGGLLWAMICCMLFQNEAWFVLYFVTLGWYLVSIVTHAIIAAQKFKWVYTIYLVLASTAVVCWFLGTWQLFLKGIVIYTLAYAGPILALLYIITCVLENRHLKRRPLSFLL